MPQIALHLPLVTVQGHTRTYFNSTAAEGFHVPFNRTYFQSYAFKHLSGSEAAVSGSVPGRVDIFNKRFYPGARRDYGADL